MQGVKRPEYGGDPLASEFEVAGGEVSRPFLQAAVGEEFALQGHQSVYVVPELAFLGFEQAFLQVRVAIREEDDALQLGLAPSTPLIRLHRAPLGLGASLAEAVAALSRDRRLKDAQAVAVLLGDMPRFQPETLLTLQQCITRDTIWRPCFRGQPGHPVLFGRDFWPALAGIDGESGAASLIRQHASHYRTHDVDDAGVVFDVDTPDTLSNLKDAL